MKKVNRRFFGQRIRGDAKKWKQWTQEIVERASCFCLCSSHSCLRQKMISRIKFGSNSRTQQKLKCQKHSRTNSFKFCLATAHVATVHLHEPVKHAQLSHDIWNTVVMQHGHVAITVMLTLFFPLAWPLMLCGTVLCKESINMKILYKRGGTSRCETPCWDKINPQGVKTQLGGATSISKWKQQQQSRGERGNTVPPARTVAPRPAPRSNRPKRGRNPTPKNTSDGGTSTFHPLIAKRSLLTPTLLPTN